MYLGGALSGDGHKGERARERERERERERARERERYVEEDRP